MKLLINVRTRSFCVVFDMRTYFLVRPAITVRAMRNIQLNKGGGGGAVGGRGCGWGVGGWVAYRATIHPRLYCC